MLPILLVLSLLGFISCEAKEKMQPSTEVSAPAPTPTPSAAPPVQNSTPEAAVKNFYEAIAQEKFDVAWKNLSQESQNKLIKMVAEEEKMKEDDVRKLFDENRKSIQLGFWKSFRESSKLAQYAPSAQYQVLSQEGGQSTVQMKSGEVALDAKAVQENGTWKMGYAESFLN